uniref:procollagen-proline 4-dioxygenase n=1 Tax=Chlamydomonas leiostraca TaxID=1034604 RepID=A0A7S0RYG0_9CHLO|mmetsp:Transcript_3499/g.8722  ORF Transcript_3499/g.8722 Transcript_3499/m.8722 type:complete len:272 (+) Transcript_3499:120-935(+)
MIAPAFLLILASVLGLSSATLPKGAIQGTGHTVGFGELKEEWRGEVIHLSWSPRAFLLKNFLSDEECEHLISKAKPRMAKSSVVDNNTGKSVDSQIRTSTGTFFARAEDDVITRIEKRVAQVTMIPKDNQEGMQILNYHDGQKYEPHFDFFHDQLNARPENGGQRVVTVLMYLTTVEEGGETVFKREGEDFGNRTIADWRSCSDGLGVKVKPKQGDAVLFWSTTPDLELDPHSLHGACPVIKGEKWSAAKWIHEKPLMRNRHRSTRSVNKN